MPSETSLTVTQAAEKITAAAEESYEKSLQVASELNGNQAFRIAAWLMYAVGFRFEGMGDKEWLDEGETILKVIGGNVHVLSEAERRQLQKSASSDTKCPRCGKGQDTDSDGNCSICARLTDAQVVRLLHKKPVFCEECGQSLVENPTGRFSRFTGKAITVFVCPNLKCSDGCGANGGHQTGWFSDTCKRCGTYCGGM